jgi:hypothetical protein
MKASEAIYTQEAYPAYDYCVTKQSNTARYNSAEIYSTNAQHVFWLASSMEVYPDFYVSKSLVAK